MSIESHNSNQMKSRWHGPNLYVTIVGIYLLVSLGTVLSITAYYHLYLLPSGPCLGPGCGLIVPIGYAVYISLIILAVLSILGSIRLLRRRRSGVRLAFAALIFTTLVLPLTAGLFAAFLTAGLDVIAFYVAIASSLASASVMYPLLIIGWKRVEWS